MRNMEYDLDNEISETYISMYESIDEMSIESIKRVPNISRKVNSMLKHFIEIEDYRKCSKLKKILENIQKSKND
jgi:hypothetical protein